jgi:hypothetical protein
MTASSVGSAIDEGTQPNGNVRFSCRYRRKTRRSVDIAKTTQMTQSGSSEARGSQFALSGVPVLLEIDYKLVAKMTKRLLECVCRQVSAEGFQRLGLRIALRLAPGLTIPDPIARSTQRETARSISSDGTTSLAIRRPSGVSARNVRSNRIASRASRSPT